MQLAAAQRRLAHEYGHRNWAELMNAVASMSAAGNDGTNPSRPSGSLPISESSANVFPLLPLRGLVTFRTSRIRFSLDARSRYALWSMQWIGSFR
jgi:hypothetical protein